MTTTQHFKAGDKVRIREGGWGIHPAHVGKIVTIHANKGNGRYTTVESLTDHATSFPHIGKESTADYRSFELAVEVLEPVAELRQLNAQIEELQLQLLTLTQRKGVVAAVVRQELKL
jgi:hypothetical protein